MRISAVSKNVLKGMTVGAVMLAATLPVFAAEQIRGIDFIATPGETNILIKSDTSVPYRTVMVTNQKVIIDLDNVNAEDSIDTFFKGTGNVSHVVLQPLSQHKLRMIIRGEALGNPVIGFDRGGNIKTPAPKSNTEEGWMEEANNTLSQIGDEGTSAATYNPDELNADDNMHNANDTRGSVASTAAAAEAHNHLAQAPAAPEPAITPEPTMDSTLGGNQPIREAGNNAKQSNNPLNNLPPVNDMAIYGLAGALLLGLGVFIKRKVDQLRNANASLDTLIADHEQGKKVNFRDLANAYRADKAQGSAPAPRKTGSNPTSKKTGSLIGLSRLDTPAPAENAPIPGDAPMNGDTLRLLQNRLASASRNNFIPDKMQTAAPARQALQQYAKTQQPAAKPKAPAAPRDFKPQAAQPQHAPDEVLRAELNRARELQSRMNPRAGKPAAPITPSLGSNSSLSAQGLKKPAIQQTRSAKSLGKNSPLPDNPEVLNFLKDIADRIEKEGNPNLAASINKNIRPKTV